MRKRSKLTNEIKDLVLAGKQHYEIAGELGVQISVVRDRTNYLVKVGELPAKGAVRNALVELADSKAIPKSFAKYALRVVKEESAVEELLSVWVLQSGCCALTGRPFGDTPPTMPVIVTHPQSGYMLISAGINRLRSNMPIDTFIQLCQLVADKYKK